MQEDVAAEPAVKSADGEAGEDASMAFTSKHLEALSTGSCPTDIDRRSTLWNRWKRHCSSKWVTVVRVIVAWQKKPTMASVRKHRKREGWFITAFEV